MSNYPAFIKEKLLSLIKSLDQRKEHFVKNPRKDFTRKRKLPFETIVALVLSMGGGSLGNELLEYFNYNIATVSSSAFTQMRSKLLPKTFKVLLHEFTNSFNSYRTFKGYRLIAVDGSDLLIPHDPNNKETYFQSTPNSKGFNLIHVNAMYDLINKIYIDASVQLGRKKHETKALIDMVVESPLDGDVLLLADRGYESYNVFAHIMEKDWKFLIRVKNTKSKSMLSTFDLPDSGEFDIHIQRILTRKQTNAIKAQPGVYKFIPKASTFDFFNPRGNPFYKMAFRVVRVMLEDGSYQSFITNLDAKEFTINQIRELYHMRWGIETSFRDLKHTLALTHFHTKKMECITQEIFAKMVMYNFCSIITSHVVIQKKQRKHGYQINFSKAINICKYFFRLRNNPHPPDVEALIQKYVLPIRKGRSNPRKVKFRTFVSFNYRVS